MACRREPEQLDLPLGRPKPQPRAKASWELALEEGRRLTLDERMERRAAWCDEHETHYCPLCADGPAEPVRQRRAAEVGEVDLRQLWEDDPEAAAELTRRARVMLARGVEPIEVGRETGIRRNTLHQWQTRMQEREDERQQPMPFH
ncbi:hypothetical protein Mx8p31 [Myxococcus phage Mx8]|uniref:p31 n=1 Tax=Myxococcus phage Mx8 TaxID=49964 RepID=Q94MT8_9CAUD|nr:hypothetical protein Mx8p31 [Myxococcus phage Mx8]AAK94366.1 p31 [Myxococcus phage Mx8]